MPVVLLYALTAFGAVAALLAPLEAGFAVLVFAWLVIPFGLHLPGFPHALVIDRIILVAFVVRLVARSGRPGEPAGAAYRPGAVHAAWVVLLLVGCVNGALLAQGSVHDNLDLWLTFLDAAVVFVVGLAVVRTIGVWRQLRLVVAFVALAAGIGIIERLIGHSWSNYLVEKLPIGDRILIPFSLLTRGGAVRSQGASSFAVEYGWVLAMILPLVAVAVGTWMARHPEWRRPRYLLAMVPVAGVLALAFSESRSAEIGIAGAALLLVVTAGFPFRLTAAVVGAVVVLALIGLGAPSLIGSPFSAAAHTNSISGRLARLPIIFQLAVHRPFTGIGYLGYSSAFGGADDAYALTFGQTGMAGLLAFLGVLVATFATACRSLRFPRRSAGRELGGACVVGSLAVAVGAAGYDLTATEQSMWALALLGVIAVALADQLPVRAHPRRRSPARVLFPLAGVLAGVAALAMAPVGFSRSYLVYFIAPNVLEAGTGVNGYAANVLAETVCGFLGVPALRHPGATLHCQQPSQVETKAYPAEVDVRIGGESASAVNAAAHRALSPFRGYGYPTVAEVGAIQSGKPAWATTAPLTGAVAGIVAAFVIPPIPFRRRGVSLQKSP